MDHTEKFSISFKSRISISIALAVFYAAFKHLYELIISGSATGSASILIEAMLFGLIMGFATTYLMQRFGSNLVTSLGRGIKPQLDADETILREGGANLFRNKISVGGKLFLTSKKLIFASHRLNFHRGQTNIELRIISDIQLRKIGIADNGIRISTNKGDVYDLVLHNRDEWIRKLNELVS